DDDTRNGCFASRCARSHRIGQASSAVAPDGPRNAHGRCAETVRYRTAPSPAPPGFFRASLPLRYRTGAESTRLRAPDIVRQGGARNRTLVCRAGAAGNSALEAVAAAAGYGLAHRLNTSTMRVQRRSGRSPDPAGNKSLDLLRRCTRDLATRSPTTATRCS